MKNRYEVTGIEHQNSPCLIYYEDIIRENIQKIIGIAGTAERLWPHVKSHKSIDMIRLQMEYGIHKFKTATVAEAEMAAQAGADKVILAYPLVGPNMDRFIDLITAYSNTEFLGIEDDYEQLVKLSALCEKRNVQVSILLDVNMGMNRTGVAIDDLEMLYRKSIQLSGITIVGLHCYDGNHNDSDLDIRNAKVAKIDKKINDIIERLRADSIACDIVVAGGTPSFPCHIRNTNWYVSPGTAFINDAGYFQNLQDIPCQPGAAVMTRVISHPAEGMFTIDLGYKGIAADPVGQRGYIVGLEDAVPIVHSEEHWAFRLDDIRRVPEIGTCLYVIPTHICPTSALYPEIFVVKEGYITKVWEVTARNRKITF